MAGGPVVVRRRAALRPFQVAGLRLWLDASEIVGLDHNDLVQAWPDMSGNGNDAAQATEAKRPTYRTSVANGLPAVWFDATDDALSVADDASLDFGVEDFTLVIAFIREENEITNARLISKGALLDTAEDPGNYGWGIDGSNGQIVFRLGNGGGGRVGATMPGVSTGVVTVTTVSVESGVVQRTFLNGGASNTGDLSSYPGPYDSELSLTLGSRPSEDGTFWPGYVCEVALYAGLLEGSVRVALERGLADKWGGAA